MNDFYPLVLIFVPVLAFAGFVGWALRRWSGRQNDSNRARCKVAQVGFLLVIAVFLIELSGRIWLFSMGQEPAWLPHPAIGMAMVTTGSIYWNLRRKVNSSLHCVEER